MLFALTLFVNKVTILSAIQAVWSDKQNKFSCFENIENNICNAFNVQ